MTVTPTATDRRARALAKRLIAKQGRTLVLRRPTRVEIKTGPSAGTVTSSPLSTSALVLDGAHPLGASVLDLRAASVTGLLVAGDRLTIAGTTYTVTGGPHAAASNALVSVAISPALAAGASDGDAVAVVFTGTDATIKGVVSEISRGLIDGQLTKAGDLQVLVSAQALDEAGLEILPEHDLFLGADVGTADLAEIVLVSPIASGEQDAALRVVARLR